MKAYPKEEQLQKIREWACEDFHNLMDYVRELWEFPEFGWRRDGEIYYISTAGWSGNEELISALEDNMLFWVMYLEQYRRGGHYIFCICSLENIKKLEKR